MKKLGIQVLRCDTTRFVFQMTDEEKMHLKNRHNEILSTALTMDADVLVLDEALDACSMGLIDKTLLHKAILARPPKQELIITGHTKVDWIFEKADYITRMTKEKHPFDSGIPARKGIEF